MKNARKHFFLLIALLVYVILLTVSASAADIIDTGNCGVGLSWTLDEEYTLIDFDYPKKLSKTAI